MYDEAGGAVDFVHIMISCEHVSVQISTTTTTLVKRKRRKLEERGCRWRWSAAYKEEQSHTVCREQHKEYKERVYGGKNGIYYSFALLTLGFPPKLLCKTHPEIAQCFWYFSGVPAKQSLTSTTEGEKTLAESEMVKKWGARVPANGVLAPDVPPIPPLPPQSATTSRGTSMPVGKGEERERMCVCCVDVVGKGPAVWIYLCFPGMASAHLRFDWF